MNKHKKGDVLTESHMMNLPCYFLFLLSCFSLNHHARLCFHVSWSIEPVFLSKRRPNNIIENRVISIFKTKNFCLLLFGNLILDYLFIYLFILIFWLICLFLFSFKMTEATGRFPFVNTASIYSHSRLNRIVMNYSFFSIFFFC